MTILWSNNASTTITGSITPTATSVAIAAGSVSTTAIDEMRAYLALGAVDVDSVPRLYGQNSGSTQYIGASARF